MEDILDLKCAARGDKIITDIGSDEKNKIESVITRSLGVLQEDGVYAFALYLASKKGKNRSVEEKTVSSVFANAFGLLKELRLLSASSEDFLKAVLTDFARNLADLLFAKDLLERTLVYARYHAKALEEKK